MSLSNRLLLMVTILMGLYAFVVYGIQRLVIMPDFQNLERIEGERDVERTYEVLTKKIGDVEDVGHTIAAMPVVVKSVASGNVDSLNKELDIGHFLQNKVSLIYLFDLKGNVLWGKVYELDTLKEVYLPNFRQTLKNHGDDLLKHDSIYSAQGGLIVSDLGPMLLVSLPVHDDSPEKKIIGTIVAGRFVDNDIINSISTETKVAVQFWPSGGSIIPRSKLPIFNALVKEKGIYREEDGNVVHLYSLLPDVNDEPKILMEVTLSKDITNQAAQTLLFTFLMLLAAALIVIIALYLSIQRVVIKPIVLLRNHITEIREKNEFSRTLNLKRSDEIGKLVEEFNGMMDQLNVARSSLLEQSRYSSVAHVASNVLNSVRNTIKPLVMSIEAIKARIGENLQAGSSPSKQEQEMLEQKLTKLLEEATTVMKVVNVQDSLDDQMEILADIKLGRILKEAVDLVPKDLTEGIQITVSPNANQFRPAHTHRSALRQIVMELISNAAASIHRAGVKDGKIDLDVSTVAGSAGSQMHIQIIDNGEGIAPENLETIFQRSEKQTDSLHPDLQWCRNTTSAMNGKIYATSKGPGEGSRLHLIIPNQQ
jgi:signal transduction histidine kinase